MAATEQDRALGALLGGALGDALGMPTQTLGRAEIAALHGEITDFVAPSADHPVAAGLPAAAVTDDTEQTLLLARQLLASPERFDERAWAASLLAWERDVAARGLKDLLGPSTKRALARLEAGASAAEAGRDGDTNGAAMRVAPVGIATPPEPLAALLDRVEESCRVTHNSGEAIAAAAAVAAAVSAGVEGGDLGAALDLALAAAREGGTRGLTGRGGQVAARIEAALRLAESGDRLALAETVGTSVAARESVPTAFGVLRLAGGEAWPAGLIAAGLGDDTDTIGAMAGAMAGALQGAAALPADKVARLLAVNALDLAPLVTGLLALRRSRRIEDGRRARLA